MAGIYFTTFSLSFCVSVSLWFIPDFRDAFVHLRSNFSLACDGLEV